MTVFMAAGAHLWQAHCLTDTHRQEPGALVGDAEHAVDLVAGHALLAGGHQPEGHQPLGERDFAALHDGANRDGELLAAVAAQTQAALCGGATEARAMFAAVAERANRAIGPALRFKEGAGLGLIVKNGVGDVE